MSEAPTRRSDLRVVVFASGSPLSRAVADAAAREATLLAVVLPAAPKGLLSRIRYASRAAALGREMPARTLPFSRDLVTELGALRPDVLLVGSFPHRLSSAVLECAGRGGLNVHMSLLPRHRGVDPVFWTYWSDDACAGVSVHRLTERVDDGAILSRESVPLERGRPSRDLYMELAGRGARLAGAALGAVADGTATWTPQDESAATCETARDRREASVPFAEWGAERVWHVLSGLGDQHHDLLRDREGRPLRHGRATAYAPTSAGRVGDVEVGPRSVRLRCRDGVVTVTRGAR